MPKDLKAKRIVVTGAASGIGRAIAESAAERGARVLLADIDALKLESAASAAGPSAKTCLCDVSDHKSVEALALQAQTLMGGCDMVFVNAGIISSSRFVKFSPETVDKILGVKAAALCHSLPSGVSSSRFYLRAPNDQSLLGISACLWRA